MESTELCQQCKRNPGERYRYYYGRQDTEYGVKSSGASYSKTYKNTYEIGGYKEVCLCQVCIDEHGIARHQRDFKRSVPLLTAFGLGEILLVLAWAIVTDKALKLILFFLLFILGLIVFGTINSLISEWNFSKADLATRREVMAKEIGVDTLPLVLIKAEVAKEGNKYDKFWTYGEYNRIVLFSNRSE